MKNTRFLVWNYLERINKKLADQGYGVRLKMEFNFRSRRFESYLSDLSEPSYHHREFGNLTEDKALKFVEGFEFGLALGLMEFEWTKGYQKE
jgi:hypothetical protein